MREKLHNVFSVLFRNFILAPFPEYFENGKIFWHAVCAKMCPLWPSNGMKKMRKNRWGNCEKSCIMCFQYYSGTLFWPLFVNISRTKNYCDMRFAQKCAPYHLLMVYRKLEKSDEANARKTAWCVFSTIPELYFGSFSGIYRERKDILTCGLRQIVPTMTF